ncbi:hypothetical protein FZI85_29085 [Mycobacterium sp. CBMA293]|uniref:hypothetical protein n=2 Tax=unclassified Mycolicibacterium TaxID=2636767 RepID=UPI0012DD086A|nr:MULTISPECIES: hypothetical protein [unclassified Mycolicibacterium]MUL61615.1 hypothetical protein [Mycolicibacterium sp. CBMA 335]MUM15050.1 hypothetical protein [Mycolicibacterium sp. CBMA 293]MUM35109.1 hypothetical protein [Mycolicibacterium sp. CBMA 361]
MRSENREALTVGRSWFGSTMLKKEFDIVHRTRRAVTLIAAATLLAGCDTVNSLANGVTNPMTPEQARRQVVDAATDVSHLIAKPFESAKFWRSSCSDGDQGPFRGVVNIAYQPPADPHAAAAAFDDMTQRLRQGGWAADSDFKSHSTALKKGGVNAVLSPANASVAVVVVEILGECRDTTTTKATKGDSETLQLPIN